MEEKKRKRISVTILSIFLILIVLGTVFAFTSLDKGQLGIYDYKAFPQNIKLGLDLEGGVYAVFEINEKEITDNDLLENKDNALTDAIAGTAKGLEDLLLSKGYTEAVVSTSGTGLSTRIRVEVPDVDDPEQIFALIGRPKTLHFKKTKNDDFTSKDVILTGKNVKSAKVTMDENGAYAVSLEFDKEGKAAFASATQELLNKEIHIYIDKEWKIGPTVQSVISDGKAVITGGYTYKQANELAVSIQSGAFAIPLEKIESATISPTLGDSAIKNGLIAGGIGLAFIVIFLCFVYKMMGLAASLSLIWYTLTYVFFLSIFPWVQLTLPGIAGILLSIGMAVDANVIIFERVKEEFRSGNKSMMTCFKNGFKRSLSAIIDGNVTTIIGAIVLMFIGTASIKGFAITLLIGICISLISSLLVTRLILVHCILPFAGENNKLFGLKHKKEKNSEVDADIKAVAEGGKN